MTMESEKREVALDEIVCDSRLQPRAALDAETVDDYSAKYQADEPMPAVTLYFDGHTYWLADGFHRVAAAERIGLDVLMADVRAGTFRDALLFAAGANAGHGLRRSNADKRRAIGMLLADPECSTWPDREIARHCQVNHETVAAVRRDPSSEIARCGNPPTPPPSQDNGNNPEDDSRKTEETYAETLPTAYDTSPTPPKNQENGNNSSNRGEDNDEIGKHTTRTVTRNGVTYRMKIGNIGKRQPVKPPRQANPEPPRQADPLKFNDAGLLPCPFCGDLNAAIHPTEESQRVAICPNPECNVIGPRCDTPDGARKGWNRRA
jgi:hypothetical protein